MKSLLKSNLLNSQISKPSPVAGVYLFLFLVFLYSCGSFTIPFRKAKGGSLAGSGYREMTTKDYADHFHSMKSSFLQTPGIKTLNINGTSKDYLTGILNEIIGNNEIFFKDLKTANVTLLNTDAPIHFSLPKGEIFLSRGLIAKYIKHESMLVSVLAFELVRSEKMLYPKETMVPIGAIPLERMITFNRLSLEEKMEVHKWAYHLTIRNGFDGEYYLSWLQTQNRNTADFILQVGDANQITREESLFKAFLIKHSVDDNIIAKKNSSKKFYSFLNKVREEAI